MILVYAPHLTIEMGGRFLVKGRRVDLSDTK